MQSNSQDEFNKDHVTVGNGGNHYSTRAVHARERRVKPFHALIEPIIQTSTYTFDDMDDVCEYMEAEKTEPNPGGRTEYGRYGNPTIMAAEDRLAALEGAEAAVQVASGMAAITITLLSLLDTGSHMIITDDCYRRTRQFCLEYLPRFGIEFTVVPMGDYDALENAIRPETRMLVSETPTNPYLRVLDVERFTEIARRHHLISIVDSTFATPINLRPLEWGIDIVIHSATKYLGGHNDLLAGFIAGRKELLTPLRVSVGIFGGISDPNTAFLLLRGMKTLSLRVEKQNQSGQQVADFLQNHPAVEKVWYPGVVTHPDHDVAARQMEGYGGVVSFTVRGDLKTTSKVIDAMQIPFISPSLGGVESLVIQPAVMSYYDYSPEERRKLGIQDNLIRLALGIEDVEDLIADLEQSLKVVGG